MRVGDPSVNSGVSYTDLSTGGNRTAGGIAETFLIYGDTLTFHWDDLPDSCYHSVSSINSSFTSFTFSPFNSSDSSQTGPATSSYVYPNAGDGGFTFFSADGNGNSNSLAGSAGSGTFYYYECSCHGSAMQGEIIVNTYGSATHYIVSNPGTVTAGTPFNVTITALDRNNNTVGNFNDGGATVFNATEGTITPTIVTSFASSGNGTETVSVTLHTAEFQAITATDGGITGTSTGFTVNAATATHFVLSAPGSANQGASFTASVTAEDQFGNPSGSDSGASVTLSNSDTNASTASPGTVSGTTASINVIMRTTGSQTLQASGNLGSSNTASVSVGATHFAIVPSGSPIVGSNLNFTVTAEDASNAIIPSFADSVHITTSDGSAVISNANPTISGGSGVFSITFNTTGTQSVTATDTTGTQVPAVTGSTNLNVAPACSEAPKTFSNNTATNLTTAATPGPASTNPYPSQITVSGVNGVIGKLTLSLQGLTINTCPADVAFMLQGPGGQFIIPYTIIGPCSASVSNLNITLDDDAGVALPEFPNPLASGTYKPSSYVVSGFGIQPVFPASAPAGPYASPVLAAPDGKTTLSSTFGGTNPNGVWNLYAIYQPQISGAPADTATLSGWSLTITPAQTFTSNDGPIQYNDAGTPPVSPYPSQIDLTNAGLPGNVTKLTLTLNGWTDNQCMARMNFMLEAPNSQFMIPLTFVGDCTSATEGPLTVTLDDNAGVAAASYSTTLLSGVYRPASYVQTNTVCCPSPAVFAAPAPQSPGGTGTNYPASEIAQADGSATFASAFNALNPNGIWKLYVYNEFCTGTCGQTGSINSWSLTITTGCPAATSCGVSLTSGSNPSTFGQPVTFTSQVTSGVGTPNGTVTFFDGATQIGTPQTLDGTGSASIATSTLTGGPHNITTVYAGNTTFATSTSSVLVQTVNPAGTTSTITSVLPASPTVYNQPVTISAQVVNASSTGVIPSGNLRFEDNGTILATRALDSSGLASFITAGLTVGSHSFTVVFVANTDFSTSTSAAVVQTVNKGSSATALGSSVPSPVFGQSVTFTATVTAVAPSAGTPTGTVTFTDGATVLGTPTLNGSGKATLTISTLAVGAHSIGASYGGSGNFIASSKTLAVTIGQASSSAAVLTSGTPAAYGTSLTFTATISPVAPSNATPTGNVAFSDGATLLGTVALNGSGVATFTTNTLIAGTHTISASYAATTDFGTSSANVSQSVTQISSSTVVVTSGSPSVFPNNVTFTATITASFGSPTGTVTFVDGATQIGSPVAVSSGQAAISTTTLTVGTHTIHANYSGDTNFLASANTVSQVVKPGPTAQFIVSAYPTPVIAGTSHTFTVIAEDQFGNLTPAYSGNPVFSSTDAQAILPRSLSGPLTLTNGSGTFSAEFRTAGTQTLTATDSSNASITGSEAGITVKPAATAAMSVSGFPATVAGVAHTFNVTAQDQFGNTVTTYTGTVQFTSSDAQAALPASSTLTSGTSSFSATLKTSGTQSLIATDTTTSSITGSQTGISVTGAAAATLTVSGYSSPSLAGSTHSFTVSAHDSFGNVATGYSGVVHITSTDAGATLPANSTLTSGSKSFTAILVTAGTQSLTATDTATASITGTQSGITVTPGAAVRLSVGGFPVSTTAGVGHTLTVTARDSFNNVATGYSGTVVFSSSDVKAVLPASSTLTNGTKTFGVTLKTAGTQNLTATDNSNPAFTAAENGIVVNPAAASSLALTGYPSPSTAGSSNAFSVTATDAFGNLATDYTGILHFTSSDASAVLPANSTLSGGTGIFNATLKTTGSQSLTATDTVTASLTSTESGIQITDAGATKFVVSGYPSPTTAGAGSNFNVRAEDSFGNLATSYSGTVAFSSSDAQATLPANSSLTNGTKTFAATLKTAGTQSLTAKDTVTASIAGTQAGITVNPASASRIVVSGYPASTTAGIANNFTVQAKDSFGNLATGYTGTLHFTSSDTKALLPANSGLTSGARTFAATLKTNGTQSITAADTVTSSLNGSETGIAVGAAATSKLVVTAPASTSVGANLNFTVASQDQFGNATPAYTGTVQFTSTDVTAALPANSTLNSGSGSFNASLNTAGTATITAKDTSVSSITGTSAAISVSQAGSVTAVIPSSTVISFQRPLGTITISVTATAGTQLPTGTVQLLDNGKVVATLTLDSSGNATMIANVLGYGLHNLTATYSGNSNYLRSISSMVPVRITPAFRPVP